MYAFILKEIRSRTRTNVDEVQAPEIYKPMIETFNKRKSIQGWMEIFGQQI